MRFLGKLDFPKALELQYHGNLNALLQSFTRQPTIGLNSEAMSPGLHLKPNQEQKRKKQAEWLQKYIEREAFREKVETGVISDLRKLFDSNGSRNLNNLPVISPIQNERTIFLSKAIRLQPSLANLRYDPSDQN